MTTVKLTAKEMESVEDDEYFTRAPLQHLPNDPLTKTRLMFLNKWGENFKRQGADTEEIRLSFFFGKNDSHHIQFKPDTPRAEIAKLLRTLANLVEARP